MTVRLWSVVLIAELLTAAAVATTINLPDFTNRVLRPKTRSEDFDIIPFNQQVSRTVNRSKTNFHFLIHQATERSLSVTVMPCSSRLDWDLKFLIQNSTINLKKDSWKNSELLVEYTGVSRPVTYFSAKPKMGLYTISAEALDDESSQVTLYVTLRSKWSGNRFDDVYPNDIKIKDDGRKIGLRWKPSQMDHHLMEYCLVVSTSKIYPTLCEAQYRLKEKRKSDPSSIIDPRDDLTLDDTLDIYHLGPSTNYMLSDLIYGETYYFTVFSLNGSLVAMQHANATYTFQKPKPVGLKDGHPKTANLRAHSGKASFRYKVGNGTTDGSALYWYVMPCSGVVNVEIRCKKTVLAKKRVFGYEKLILQDAKPGERYVLRVEAVSADETQRVRSIEVMATVRAATFPMPDMPDDLSIRHYVKPEDCNSVTFGWLPAKSDTGVLTYCVHLQEYRYGNSVGVDFSARPDQCKLSYGKRTKSDVYNYRKKKCFQSNTESGVEVEKILKLKSSTTYVIQVTATKKRGRTLSYDLLKFDTNSCGLN